MHTYMLACLLHADMDGMLTQVEAFRSCMFQLVIGCFRSCPVALLFWTASWSLKFMYVERFDFKIKVCRALKP